MSAEATYHDGRRCEWCGTPIADQETKQRRCCTRACQLANWRHRDHLYRPEVVLPHDTYERLRVAARQRGRTPDELATLILESFLFHPVTTPR